jgi:hypothetical protein
VTAPQAVAVVFGGDVSLAAHRVTRSTPTG